MKKIFAVFCVLAVIVFIFNDSSPNGIYTRDDLEEAKHEAWQEGYEEGYADAEYYLRPDIWKAEEIAADRGYEDGYDVGYDDGYYDCLEEHGLLPEPEEPKVRARIEKERD